MILPPVPNPVSYQITVSTAIGEPLLTLYGWTSPKSLVRLSGQRVTDEVISDDKGYFFFDRVFLPGANPDYPELCLSAIDTQSRISFPTCLAPLPGGPFNFNIGPVLLSPTISLSGTTANGATIPNVPVTITLATQPTRRLVTAAQAYFLPHYQISSDENGNFEFSLPDEEPWRLFASAQFQNFATPKSNTLTFQKPSFWIWLWELILKLLKPYGWFLILIMEMIILIGLVRGKRRAPSGTRLGRRLVLAKNILPR